MLIDQMGSWLGVGHLSERFRMKRFGGASTLYLSFKGWEGWGGLLVGL